VHSFTFKSSMYDVAVRRSQEREPAQIDPVQSSRGKYNLQNTVALQVELG
jgi:hypothetical protein